MAICFKPIIFKVNLSKTQLSQWYFHKIPKQFEPNFMVRKKWQNDLWFIESIFCTLDTGHLSVIWWLPSWTRSVPLPACCFFCSSSLSSSPCSVCRCLEGSSIFPTSPNLAAPLIASLRLSSLCSRYKSFGGRWGISFFFFFLASIVDLWGFEAWLKDRTDKQLHWRKTCGKINDVYVSCIYTFMPFPTHKHPLYLYTHSSVVSLNVTPKAPSNWLHVTTVKPINTEWKYKVAEQCSCVSVLSFNQAS